MANGEELARALSAPPQQIPRNEIAAALARVGGWLQRRDQRAQDWMARQRGHLNRIRDFGEQRQMIWPGVAADAGIGLLDLIQGPRTGVMTPEAIMALMDVGTLGVKPPGALGALAFRGSPHRDASALPIRPARENLRTVVDSNTIGGRVSGDEMVPIDSLSGGPSLSARGQKAVDDIVEQMSGADGFIERLIVDQDNNVIEGAHRVEALRRLGFKQVPITRIVDPTANLDLSTMRSAIEDVGGIHSDNVNQIMAQVGDMLAEVGNDPQKVLREFDFPVGFERHYRAALDSVQPKANPTDEASRMARAREMGFDVDAPMYHGTPDSRGIYERGFSTPKERYLDKDLGGPYFFTDNPRVARSYADDSRAGDFQNATPEVIKAYVKNNDPLIIDGRNAQFREIDLGDLRASLTKDQLKQFDEMRPNLYQYIDADKEIISTDGLAVVAKALGKDGILIKNVKDSYAGDGPISNVLAIFDPKDIRSTSAAFDPAKADSADILASQGLGAYGVAMGLLNQRPDE
jgi:hypothetical protein